MDQDSVVRSCEPDDLGFLLSLATKAYPPGTFDHDAAADWLMGMLMADGAGSLSARGQRSAGFAHIIRLPWNPDDVVADLVHLFGVRSAGLEVVAVVRLLARLAFSAGCSRFYIGSTMADLTPVARRLGAKKAGMAYVLEKGSV